MKTKGSMTQAAASLLQWLERSHTQRCELAARLNEGRGISRPYMTQILSGLRRPGLHLMLEIQSMTGIPVNAWAQKSVSESAQSGREQTGKSRVSNELTDAA